MVPDSPGHPFRTTLAFSVSPDGSVVVGYSSSGLYPEAFRWTATDGMIGLGHLPGVYYYSYAYLTLSALTNRCDTRICRGCTITAMPMVRLQTDQW